MQINGDLQATNTSNYNIRLAGIKLLEPAGVEILAQMALVKDHKTGYSSPDYLIPTRSIGDVGFMFFAVPATGVPGKPLKAAISILDQFGNEHVLRKLYWQIYRARRTLTRACQPSLALRYFSQCTAFLAAHSTSFGMSETYCGSLTPPSFVQNDVSLLPIFICTQLSKLPATAHS